MTKPSAHKKELEKFLFHMHIFDEDHVEEEEEEAPPPPPTFSEAELESTRQSAHEAGEKEGHDKAAQEAKASRAAHLTIVLQKIAEETSTLFQQERERAKLYERESVALCLSLFDKLFPAHQKKYGFEELKESISTILQKHQSQREINIQVSPDNVAGVEKLLGELTTKGFQVNFSIKGDEALADGACKMAWDDGGALRNTDTLAEEIQSLMQQMLAGTSAKGHDTDSGEQSPSESDALDAQNTDNESEDIQTPDSEPETQTEQDIAEKPDE